MANGIYTNSEIIDSLVLDLNNVLKEQQNGQFIQACCIVTQMTQKLMNLRKTIDDDLKNREQTIETLKEQIRRCGREVEDMTVQEFVDKRNDHVSVQEITEKEGAN